MNTCHEEVIAPHHTDGYTVYRIPGILPTADGAALLCCEARPDAHSDWGAIDVLVWRREKDGSRREVLHLDNAHDTCNNPTLIPDGALVHLICHHDDTRVYIRTSADNGFT